MAKEIIDLYVTCEIAKDGDGVDLVTRADAGKNFGVTLEGSADSLHPQVRVSSNDGDNIFGKLVSVTTNGKLCRVAVRGANMIFASSNPFLPQDIGSGIVGNADRGVVSAGANPDSRASGNVGAIIGGSTTEYRVDMK